VTSYNRTTGSELGWPGDVARLDGAEVVDDLVDQDLVADVERVLHGGGRYVERLDHERLDQQGDGQRDHEEDG
jgi:hypothetical protein